MKEFNAEEVRVETTSALETIKRARWVGGYPAVIGLDVHKETIAADVGSYSCLQAFYFCCRVGHPTVV